MGYRTSTIIFTLTILLFILNISFTISQPTFSYESCTGNRTNSFSKNLNKILTKISTNNKINYGFYYFSEGIPPDKVHTIISCRADLSVSSCRSHITTAISRFRETCPTGNEFIGYQGSYFMFRYSYRPIFSLYEFAPNTSVDFGPLVPNRYIKEYRQKVKDLFNELTNKTTIGDSRKKYAAGSVNISGSIQAYALIQCTPDLSKSDCLTCLRRAISGIRLCCFKNTGLGVCLPSCVVVFHNYPFLDEDGNKSTSSVTFLPSSSSSHFTIMGGKKMHIICGSVFALLTIASVLYFFSRRKKASEKCGSEQIQCVDYMEFDYDILVAATENFSDCKRFGKGNCDAVYKGMLPSGQEIAVKRLEKYGRDVALKFNNEVHLLTNLQHINVVKLLGFCKKDDLWFLIYEFLCNGSLDTFLNVADSMKLATFEWETRHNIIQGIARGLHYLHEDSQLHVIHRDLKASNILLSAQMKPKISNFTKASHNLIDQTRRGDNSAIKGTYGYMAPEYMEHGQFSAQSDVFSFGVILLEILCGQMIVFSKEESKVNLLCSAWQHWKEGRSLDVIDPTLLRIKCHTNAILRCFKIALLCVQEDPTRRPTMASISFMLINESILIEDPTKTDFCSPKMDL